MGAGAEIEARHLVAKVLFQAVHDRLSEIHIIPDYDGESTEVCLRIYLRRSDSDLPCERVKDPDGAVGDEVVAQLAAKAGIGRLGANDPSVGAFAMNTSHGQVRFRVSFWPGALGTRVLITPCGVEGVGEGAAEPAAKQETEIDASIDEVLDNAFRDGAQGPEGVCGGAPDAADLPQDDLAFLMAVDEILGGERGFPADSRTLVADDVAAHFGVVPVLREGDIIYVAVLDAEVGEEIGSLPELAGLTIKPVPVERAAMERLLERYRS